LVNKYKIFPTKVYYVPNTKNYVFHIKIPTEQSNLKKPLYYDTVIEFYLPDNKLNEEFKSLLAYNIRVWSNSPAFMFTYMYTANKYNLIPKWLIGKSSKEALKKPPMVRNPVEIIGYEKSLNFAGQYILLREYFKIINIKSYAEKFDIKTVLKEISSSDDKLSEYSVVTKSKKKIPKKPKNKGVRVTVKKMTKVKSKKIKNKKVIGRRTKKSRTVKSI